MTRIAVDTMQFTFPDGWKVTKYDDWDFYRSLSNFIQGTKAVDLIAISPDKTVWLIEVKDYSVHRREKTLDIYSEIVKKTMDTLAAIFPAKVGADDVAEKTWAGDVLGCKKIRVVLHLEQTNKPSKIFPREIDLANTKAKLKKRIKPIDPHPGVVETSNMRNLPWSVVRQCPPKNATPV